MQEKRPQQRLAMYFLGLFIITIGIAISVKSNLGVTPVSSISYTMTCVLGMMVISTFCIACGIFLYVPPGIMPLAIEGTMETISKVTKIEFPKVRIGFDCTMVVISLVSCLIGIHGLGSVGIGWAFPEQQKSLKSF